MCWSASVSLAFSLLDVFMIAFLLRRRRGRDVTYASFLIPVAIQEVVQFLIWSTGAALHPGDACEPWKAGLSAGTLFVPHSVPVVMAWRSFADRRREGKDDAGCAKKRLWAFGLSAAALLLALAACIATGNFCVKVGPRHHQVWICSSLYEVGGYPLFISLLAIYAVAIVFAFFALLLPEHEKRWLGAIGFITLGVSYGIYVWTLEACSVWCWSAFSIGAYAVLRPLPANITGRNSTGISSISGAIQTKFDAEKSGLIQVNDWSNNK